MIRQLLFVGSTFTLDVHGRRIVSETESLAIVAEQVGEDSLDAAREAPQETKQEKEQRRAAREAKAAKVETTPTTTTIPPKHQPPSLVGYGVLEDHNCGGSWIETWSDGQGTGYGKGSPGNFAGCESKCTTYKECEGFFYQIDAQVCSHYRKDLAPKPAKGFNCFYKLSAFSVPVHQPHLKSVPSGIIAGVVGDTILHHAYPHHVKLMDPSNFKSGLSKIKAPTKGEMEAVVGDTWEMQVDLSEAEALSFLPAGEPSKEREGKFKYDIKLQVQSWDKDDDTKRKALFAWEGWYWTGKLFQKVGTICLMSEKYFGISDPTTQTCAKILELDSNVYMAPHLLESLERMPQVCVAGSPPDITTPSHGVASPVSMVMTI